MNRNPAPGTGSSHPDDGPPRRSWSPDPVTIIGISLLAVLLVVAGLTVWTRNRRPQQAERAGGKAGDRNHRRRKAQRAQSQRDRRKRR
jgi:hypothetical protein